MELFMLDTVTASYVIKGNPPSVREQMLKIPMVNLCISAITEAELLHGVARKPEAKNFPIVVKGFLQRIDILPWDSDAAKVYASLRYNCEKNGISLGSMDMLIAAHAISAGAVLVTNDRAFNNVKNNDLRLADWSA